MSARDGLGLLPFADYADADPNRLPLDDVLADVVDDIHTARTHRGGPCHGDNDGCQGGPDPYECELGDEVFGRMLGGVQ